MPRGSKASYSGKQKRQAKHIEDSEKKGGRSAKTAARIAWATVNKETGGAKGNHKGARPGTRKSSRSHSSSHSHSHA